MLIPINLPTIVDRITLRAISRARCPIVRRLEPLRARMCVSLSTESRQKEILPRKNLSMYDIDRADFPEIGTKKRI